MIETSPSPAGRSPQRGRVGALHEKGGRLFHGNPGRGCEKSRSDGIIQNEVVLKRMLSYEVCLSQPSPQPLSQRDKHCSRSERGAYPLKCKQPLVLPTKKGRLSPSFFAASGSYFFAGAAWPESAGAAALSLPDIGPGALTCSIRSLFHSPSTRT